MADSSFPFAFRLIVRYALTVLLLWLLTRYLPQYLVIDGSLAALPTVAALIVLLNLFARPILKILTLPLKVFMTIVATVLTNALFLWIVTVVTERFDPSTAVFLVQGGLGGWLVVAVALGLGNWVLQRVS